jgi:biotin transport system substrate-specific component
MILPNTLSLKKEHAFLRDMFLVVLSGLLITLMGQVSIPLPFTPIPISFRFQTVLLLSILLGSRRAVLSVAFFLLQGVFGLPVFAVGPVAGYLAGYLVAACVVGYMSEKRIQAPLSFLVGTLIVYVCGAAYLSTLIGLQKALLLGVVPFIVGDLLKTMVYLKILAWYQKRYV